MQRRKIEALPQAFSGDLEAPADFDVEVSLRTDADRQMLEFAVLGEIALLTTFGRAFVAILEDPTVTIRALSVYLGVSESSAQKAVRDLMNRGLVAKTKVGNRTEFVFCPNREFLHPDIRRLFDAVAAHVAKKPIGPADIQPADPDDPPF